jgi:hypothetical protein
MSRDEAEAELFKWALERGLVDQQGNPVAAAPADRTAMDGTTPPDATGSSGS